MAWSPPTPAQPTPGWWDQYQRQLVCRDNERWISDLCAQVRAERIDGLRELADRIDRRARDALVRQAVEHAQVRQWGPGHEVDQEYAAYHALGVELGLEPGVRHGHEVEHVAGGPVLGVR